MPLKVAREIGLLRTLARHLERRPLPLKRWTQELLRAERLGHIREREGGITAIRMPGHNAFNELTDCLLDRFPAMQRGILYSDIQTELFDFIEDYVGRDPATIADENARVLVAHFAKWFADKTSLRRVFVPCVISRTPAPRFKIGPVTFEFIDHVETSNFYPQGGEDAIFDQHGFDALLRWMRQRDADWLARVSVDGCEQKRAEEIAELAVDLVIVALQLAAPYLDTRGMSRLDARRGTSEKRTLSEAGGYHSAGWTRKEPGLAIGAGTLPDIMKKAESLFIAVGNVVRSFALGSFRLPIIEQAWCDAAYWFHQAMSESIDTIAVAKLETAVEVLFQAESSMGSQQRMLEILNAFFEVGPEDPIAPGSTQSAKQFARNVVRDRSRILHGTWSTLNARGIDRAGMEGFVVTVLRTAVIELEAYAHSDGVADDTGQFLTWVYQRKLASARPRV